MAINKIKYGNEVLIDLSNDTVSAETVARGVTTHDAHGEAITGKMSLTVAVVPEFAQSEEACIDTSKLYVLPDGYIYAYRYTETPIEPYTNLFDVNKAKIGYGLNSSGNEAAYGERVLTDYIPVSELLSKRIHIKGISNTTYFRMACYDSDKALTGYTNVPTTDFVTAEYDDSAITYTMPQTATAFNLASYVRFAFTPAASAEEIILTFDEDIFGEAESVGGYGWVSTGHAFVPADYESRILDLEDSAAQWERKLATLETEAADTLPNYWQAAINNLKTKMDLRQLSGNKAFQFLWLSDIHGKQSGKTEHIGAVAQGVCEKYNIPLVAISGDIMSQTSHGNVADVHSEYIGCNELLSAIDKDRLLVTRGNHDGAWGEAVDGVYYLKNIGNKALFNKLYRRQATDLGRVFGDDGTYFYVDSRPHKIRFIMLNSHTDGDESVDSQGNAVYNSMKHYVYGSEQLQWLENTALNVEEGWGIVIMTHSDLWTGSDVGLLTAIIDAYNGKEDYTGEVADNEAEYWGKGLTNSEYNTSETTDKNFTGAKGEIIALFHGHQHYDFINTSLLSCPVICITTAGGDVRDTNSPTRTPNTATETAMDIVTIDRSERKIYMTRLGAGSDREVSY